ncbi:ubiquitin carboxyl-terminal hydrolase 29 [Nannospalax galili]|uniref:ubiquitin carboxyl-terminal hydrolase 29 n=1 Tax=Nannospalax galili TaxID=1026970 RepID=UPI0004ED229A|nr:ubiquitin carboxyl-terminal hydrolase 29 [Nannospalax galili]
MTHLKIHSSVQIWTEKTGMSEMKEAFIETVQGEKGHNLVVSFKFGEMRIFPLSNNISSVVVRYRGEGTHCLRLTLKNNTCLLIEKLSYIDIEQLKSFLDGFHPNRFQPFMEPKSNRNALEIRNTYNIGNKIVFSKTNDKSVYGPFNTTKESETLVPQKMPFFESNPPANPVKRERTGEKKMVLSSSLEMNGDIRQEHNHGLQRKSKRQRSKGKNLREKSMTLRSQESHRNLKPGPSFNPCSQGKPDLEETVPTHTLSDAVSWVLQYESNPCQEIPVCNTGAQDPLDMHQREPQHTGFPNLGNTCYMNAILQSLYAIPSFADDLLKQGIPWEEISPDDFILPFSQLLVLKDICEVKIKAELLLQVKNSISEVSDTFLGNMQNDAHEFLGQCFEELKENMEKLNAICNTQRETEVEVPSPRMSAGTSGNKGFVCPVLTNFQFELNISIICEACGKVTPKTEVNNYLSINLQQETQLHLLSIQNIFDLYFVPEQVEHNCVECKNKTSIFISKLSRLPRVLTVHLKRYSFDHNWLLVKNEQPVEISKYLSISDHCSGHTRPPIPLANSPLAGDNVPGVNAELRDSQRLCERANKEQQQREPDSDSDLEQELVNTGDKIILLTKKTLAASDSVMDEEDIFLPVIPHPGLADIGLQKVPEHPELKKYKNTSTSRDSRCTSRGSRQTTTERKNTVVDVNDPNNVKTGDDAYNYRLISVISHVGSSKNVGHYISDVYDFQDQMWLTYDDLQVTSVLESFMRQSRISSGYIFFYMQNEIFEALSKKTADSIPREENSLLRMA